MFSLQHGARPYLSGTHNSEGLMWTFSIAGLSSLTGVLRLRTWNAQTLIELADVDLAVTPLFGSSSSFLNGCAIV